MWRVRKYKCLFGRFAVTCHITCLVQSASNSAMFGNPSAFNTFRSERRVKEANSDESALVKSSQWVSGCKPHRLLCSASTCFKTSTSPLNVSFNISRFNLFQRPKRAIMNLISSKIPKSIRQIKLRTSDDSRALSFHERWSFTSFCLHSQSRQLSPDKLSFLPPTSVSSLLNSFLNNGPPNWD
jgi:hypothetical protein